MPPISVHFKTKLLKPCKRLLSHLFRFKFRRPISIKPFNGFQHLRKRRRRRPKEDEVSEYTDRGSRAAPLPSTPLTPALVKMGASDFVHGGGEEATEEACRSFERYVVEMVVEEGRVADMVDVEELLYCLEELKSPVFLGVVSRFYGEMCRDLFAGDGFK
ncbi:hypothetical protein QJS10_CPA07g01277 [Acorus calamus]|uniref:OVATE domain-containing protein n=1 Tax=Acorus calamus TaxID=4465 RepID=A0AAV9EGB3_ACOCL|nr:hypothetical protein QJS10_CPA07g01277 [Acorus calamus]